MVVLAGHHEYSTSRFYDALQDHHDRGGHIAFFSADDLYWQVRYERDGDIVVGHKKHARANDPLMGVADCLLTEEYHEDILQRPAEALKALRRHPEFDHFLPAEYLVQMGQGNSKKP